MEFQFVLYIVKFFGVSKENFNEEKRYRKTENENVKFHFIRRIRIDTFRLKTFR